MVDKARLATKLRQGCVVGSDDEIAVLLLCLCLLHFQAVKEAGGRIGARHRGDKGAEDAEEADDDHRMNGFRYRPEDRRGDGKALI